MHESDWQAATAYTYLDNLGSAAFAWEFLRRNPAYRAAYQAIAEQRDAAPEVSEQVAAQWGLRFAVDPDLRADCARVVWLASLNPATVVVTPAPDEFKDARPICKLKPSFSRRATNGEYWFLDHGGDDLPVALIDGADSAQPAAIVIPVEDRLDQVHMRVEAALCLLNAMAGGAPSRVPDGLTAQQRSRLGLILRSLDGQLARCPYRTIAKVLFGSNRVPAGREWRDHDLRSRTIRLCNRGLDLMHGEYLNLVRYPRQFRG